MKNKSPGNRYEPETERNMASRLIYFAKVGGRNDSPMTVKRTMMEVNDRAERAGIDEMGTRINGIEARRINDCNAEA
jgi:hypothetical protein